MERTFALDGEERAGPRREERIDEIIRDEALAKHGLDERGFRTFVGVQRKPKMRRTRADEHTLFLRQGARLRHKGREIEKRIGAHRGRLGGDETRSRGAAAPQLGLHGREGALGPLEISLDQRRGFTRRRGRGVGDGLNLRADADEFLFGHADGGRALPDAPRFTGGEQPKEREGEVEKIEFLERHGEDVRA